MKRVFLLLSLCFYVGCTTVKDDSIPSGLVGYWVSDVRESEWGPVYTKIWFSQHGKFKWTNIFVPCDEKRRRTFFKASKSFDVQGRYTVESNSLVSNEWSREGPIHFELSGVHLILSFNDGEILVFNKTAH